MRLACSIAVPLILAIILTSTAPFLVSAQTNQPTSFALPQGSRRLCRFWWGSFSLSGGELVDLQWSTRNQVPFGVDLYVAPKLEPGYSWYCDTGPDSLYYDSGTFGSLYWVAPFSHMYTLVVVNDSPYAVSGALTLTAGNTTITFSQTGYGVAIQEPVCPISQINCMP
jgi:hypothetical protein